MSSSSFERGDLVVARFRPDNVGVVERVYGQLCDVRRPGRETLKRVPVGAMTPVPTGAPLLAVGVTEFGVVWIEGVVAGAEGLLCWMQSQPPARLAKAHICAVDRRLAPFTPWEPLLNVLADDAVRTVQEAAQEAVQEAAAAQAAPAA